MFDYETSFWLFWQILRLTPSVSDWKGNLNFVILELFRITESSIVGKYRNNTFRNVGNVGRICKGGGRQSWVYLKKEYLPLVMSNTMRVLSSVSAELRGSDNFAICIVLLVST